MAQSRLSTTPVVSVADLQGEHYGSVLSRLHRVLRPTTYLEVGVYAGGTLALANCATIAVDPQFNIDEGHIFKKVLANPKAFFFRAQSDDFFAQYDVQSLFGGPVDMAFLDGMHRCEFLLRDFLNTERNCKKNSIIALHDCLPIEADITSRVNGQQSENPKRAGMWTGDVWRTALLLKRRRPDLAMTVLDAATTGLVLITNLDTANRDLAKDYRGCVDDMLSWHLTEMGLPALYSELRVESTDSLAADEAITGRFWL